MLKTEPFPSNNNSIKLTSLESVAAQVQRLFFDLSCLFAKHYQSAELAIKSARDSLLSKPIWAGFIDPTSSISDASSPSSTEEEAL
jgi:hypothetical protein